MTIEHLPLTEMDDGAHTLMDQAMQDLEELWSGFREPLRRGVSPSESATMGQVLDRAVNLTARFLRLLVRKEPTLAASMRVHEARLQRIQEHAAALRRSVEIPPPVPDPERLRRSLEQMERGEGVDLEELLSRLKG